MITSAEELIRLRTSTVKAEYDRSAREEAPLEVWWELVRDHPDMKVQRENAGRDSSIARR